MKNIVVNEEFHQSDLKPSGLLKEYIGLLEKDVKALLMPELKAVPCPACASVNAAKEFEKFGLLYKECADCQSLYIAARPSDASIAQFFVKAPSKIFWRTQLSEVSKAQRKLRIIKPRLEWVLDSTAEHLPQAEHWVDVHTGQGRYLETMAMSSFKKKTVIYPYCDPAGFPGIEVLKEPWWNIKTGIKADLVTLFEVLDHASDVNLLLNQVRSMLNEKGLCFITTILSSGFDVKVLAEHADNIYPPDRLNVFSVSGLRKLFKRHGFECLELSTPGILDLEIVAAALRLDPSIETSAFIRELALTADDDVKRAFQDFLQENLLSSYGRILIRKV